MITVKMWRDSEDIWLEVSGHAAPLNGGIERKQVCSGVSALMLTLWALVEHDGEWDGNHNGYVKVRVCEQYVAWATFAFAGIQLINDSYPGHIVLEVGPGFEESAWKPHTLLG